MPTSTAPLSLTPLLRRLALARDGGGLTDGQLLGEFVRSHDPAAFEVLVRRHGPMVLGVCRRVVRDMHLADDAFQAVWVVLARRAGVVRPREHVGNWLYGVAFHIALKARRTASRWKTREKQVSTMPHPVAPAAPVLWSDLAPILDDELSRLPDMLRLPVVLCDLEGRPQREAARQLGVPVTTLVTRLARARRTLAERLSSRGVTLSGGALAGMLSLHASAAAVPMPLTSAAVATALASGGAAAHTLPATIQYLSDGVMRMILVTKLKTVSASALVVAGLAVGLGLAAIPSAAGQSATAEPAAKQPLNTARPLDDAAFLRRACVDIRGTPPTDLEQALFRTDDDPKKRSKVVEWLLGEVPTHTTATTSSSLTGLPYSHLPNRTLAVELLNRPQTLSGLTTQTLTSSTASSPLAVTYGIPVLQQSTTQNSRYLLNTNAQPIGQTLKTIQAEDAAITLYEKAFVAQTEAGQKSGDADQAKLKQDIAAMKRKIAALEAELQARQKQAEAEDRARQTEIEKQKLEKDIAGLSAKLKALEGERTKLKDWVEKKVDGDEVKPAQNREAAATALAKLATAQKDVTQKLIEEKQMAAQEKKLLEYRRALGEAVKSRSSNDDDFLQRVIKQSYGVTATALELKYFAEDKDPKKREKLVELVLADPAVAKKLGPDGKAKLLAEPSRVTKTVTNAAGVHSAVETIYTTKIRTADPFVKLLDQVLDGKRSDEQVADAVCLATVGRYPTEAEHKMMLSSVTGSSDRRAAWKKVLDALAGTKEAQVHAESLRKK